MGHIDKRLIMKTTIEVYTIQIRKGHDYMDFGGDPDFFNVISDDETGFVHFVDNHSTGDVEQLSRTVRIPQECVTDVGDTVRFHHKNVRERYICGIIETGPYGKEFDIADKDNPADPAYRVTRNQAIIKPYFYYLKIPRRGNKALLILERTDNDGIYPLMQILLKSYLNDHYGVEQGYMVERKNVVLNEYMNELRNGRYKSMTLTANYEHSDRTDGYMDGLDNSDYTMELTIKFKNGLGLNKEAAIRNLINSNNPLFEVPDLNDIFGDSARKVVSTIGTGRASRTRTLYLGGGQENIIRPYYEIEVEANEYNFSSYRSIKEVVRDFIQEHEELNIFS